MYLISAIPASFLALTLPLPAYGFETRATPLLALGNEETLFLHVTQDTVPGHPLAKAPQQAFL